MNVASLDTTRIYAMGFSNGSMMSYRVAAGLSHRVAAIGAESGQIVYEFENCNPEYPVPNIHFHGLSDKLVPYEGNGDSILVVPHVDSVLAKWREINGCSSIPDTVYNEPGVVCKKWASSSGNSDIVLYKIQAMEHQWAYISTYNFSSTDVMWDFLKLQQRTIVYFARAQIELSCHCERNGVQRSNPMRLSTEKIASAKNASQ